MSGAQHSSESSGWGTPSVIVDLATRVLNLGQISLDPFSAPGWNRTVRAARILTEKDDAFSCAWFDGSPAAIDIFNPGATLWGPEQMTGRTALVNPPGDRTGQMVKRAWRLVEWHHASGWLDGGAIWIVFNLGQFRTTQTAGAGRSLLHPDFIRCIPSKRIPYDERPGVGSSAPSHDTAIVLLPGRGREMRQRLDFESLFGDIGEVF